MMDRLIFITSWITQALFVLAIVSGVPLLFFYHTTKAYDSLQIITYLIPDGAFIRKFHYFSSEALLIFAIIHTVEQFFSKRDRISKSSWNYGIAALICILLLLFTGFVLKSGQSGHSAGIIAISMLHSLGPFSFLSKLIESAPYHFYWRFFIWHSLLLSAMMTVFIYFHVKRIDSPINFLAIASGITVILIFFLPLPIDIAPGTIVNKINGPWFFQGIENMLDNGSLVSVIFVKMITPFFLIMIYRYSKHKIAIVASLFLWMVYYAAISLV